MEKVPDTIRLVYNVPPKVEPTSGGVAERLKAPVLKTGKGDEPFVSSNLTSSELSPVKKLKQSFIQALTSS